MRSLFGVVAVLLSLVTATFPQQASSALPAGKKQLTIDDIFREPAGNASAPQFVEWSPDGRHLSFVRANSADGRDELYSLDPATGQARVLIGAGPLAGLMAPNAKLSERERENRARYGIAAYHWAPDSKGLLFDASGQLWFYDLQTGKSTDLTGSKSLTSDPKFSPDGRYISFIRDHDLVRSPACLAPASEVEPPSGS